jgi:hypothetical protein
MAHSLLLNSIQFEAKIRGLYEIGQSVPREEDPRLLKGRGRYVDDVELAGDARASSTSTLQMFPMAQFWHSWRQKVPTRANKWR